MKESFVFYTSFLDALDELDDKTELEIYRAITHYALKNEEPELNGVAKAIFHLIKPQIDANNKRYENGKKGAGFGILGGRPKKQKPQENPKETPNVNDNVNVNVNVNDNVNVIKEKEKEKEKKLDPFINPIKTLFQEEYTKIMGKTPRLSLMECNRLTELASENKDIKEIIPEAIKRLKVLKFEGIKFTPSASWLLKGNNFERLLNGEFEPPETEYERLKRKFGSG